MPRSSSPIAHRSSLSPALVFVAIGLVTLVAYLPSFSASFQFDDYAAIIDNANEREQAGMAGLNWMGARVLPAATFMMNFRLGRDDPFGYHAVNFAVHLLACLAVFQLALALCRTPRLRDTAPARDALALAAAATFLFACHPIQTQAVTYIVQRMASMAAMFYLWSVVFYVWARIRRDNGQRAHLFFAAAAIAALCAVLSKENAVSLPLALVLVEATFFHGIGLGRVLLLVPFAVAAALVPFCWHIWSRWNLIPAGEGISTFDKIVSIAAHSISPAHLGTPVNPLHYFLTQAVVVPRYLGLVVLPLGLNVDHDVAVAQGPSFSALAGLAFLGVLAALGLALRRKQPLVAFGLLWTFATLGVESSFLPLNDVMMEHRMYLALPGLALAGAAGFVRLRERMPFAAALVALTLAVVLPGLTYSRNLVWQSAVSLWSDAARKSPSKARTQLNLGVAYHGEGRLDEAVRHYCRALDLHPSSGIAQLADENLEIALEEQGRLDEILREVLRGRSPEVAEDGTLRVEYDLAKVACR